MRHNILKEFSIEGEWKGNTAGGPYPPSISKDEEEKKEPSHELNDTNDRWFNNP